MNPRSYEAKTLEESGNAKTVAVVKFNNEKLAGSWKQDGSHQGERFQGLLLKKGNGQTILSAEAKHDEYYPGKAVPGKSD